MSACKCSGKELLFQVNIVALKLFVNIFVLEVVEMGKRLHVTCPLILVVEVKWVS
jgi:hypothetical protein